MLKKFLLTGAALALLPMAAFANLSDGVATAIQRWGKPFAYSNLANGVHASYESNGWLIEQFYDADGRAVAVKYYKLHAEDKPVSFITQSEINALWLANVLGEGPNAHWVYQPESTANQQMWYSEEVKATIHLELVKSGQTYVPCLIFATCPVGVNLILEDLKKSPEPANDHITITKSNTIPL